MNINKYLTPIFMTFLFCCFASCKQRQEIDNSTKLLMELLDDRQTRNKNLLMNIQAKTEEKGNRKSDLEIVKLSKTLYAFREDKGLNYTPAQLESQKFNVSQLDAYQSYLDSVMERNYSSSRESGWMFHQASINYFQSLNDIHNNLNAKLNILLSLGFLETKLMSGFAEYIGSTDLDDSITFSFNMSSDTMKVGEELEMIVYPRGMELDYDIKHKFDSTQILYNGAPLEDQLFKDISGVLYIKFIPKYRGKYQLRTSFKSIYKEGLFVSSQLIEKELNITN